MTGCSDEKLSIQVPRESNSSFGTLPPKLELVAASVLRQLRRRRNVETRMVSGILPARPRGFAHVAAGTGKNRPKVSGTAIAERYLNACVWNLVQARSA